MFGKILLTVAVVAIIWFGYRYALRRAEVAKREKDAPPKSGAAGPAATNGIEAEAMAECRVCGTWQPARGAKSCGRSDCPY